MKKEKSKKGLVVAKKSFEVHQNDFHLVITEGDEIDLGKIPEIYHDNLRAEGVILEESES